VLIETAVGAVLALAAIVVSQLVRTERNTSRVQNTRGGLRFRLISESDLSAVDQILRDADTIWARAIEPREFAIRDHELTPLDLLHLGPLMQVAIDPAGLVVGLLMFTPVPEYIGRAGFVVDTLVHPAHRGRGYGREILQVGIDLARRKGVDAWFWTDPQNHVMRELARTLEMREYPPVRTWLRSDGVAFDAVWYVAHVAGRVRDRR